MSAVPRNRKSNVIAGALGSMVERMHDLAGPMAFGRFVLTLLLLYTASYGWIFLVPADFWDDLAVKNNPDLIQMGYDSGLPTVGYYLTALLSLPHADLIGRLLIFLFYFLGILLYRGFAIRAKILSRDQIDTISIITATLPLFQSRFLVASSYYSFSFFAFCAASYLLIRSVRSGNLLVRLVSYLLFFLSFVTASFVVAYGITVLLLVYSFYDRSSLRNIVAGFFSALLALLKRAPDIFAVPFVFFFGKLMLFPTSGPFVTYNSVGLRGLRNAVSSLIPRTLDALTTLNGNGVAWNVVVYVTIFVFVVLAGTSLLFRSGSPAGSTECKAANWVGLAVSSLCLMLAVFPYSVVGRSVTPFDFDDRNQLTMIFAAGAFIYFLAAMVLKRFFFKAAIVLTILWGISNNVTTYLSVIVDGHIQNAFVQEARKNETLRSHKTFLFDTSRWPDLARRRTFSSAQLNCLLKDAFGDETRYSTVVDSLPVDWRGSYDLTRQFLLTGSCFRDYREDADIKLVFVDRGSKKLSQMQALRLSVERLTSGDSYARKLDNLVSIFAVDADKGMIRQP